MFSWIKNIQELKAFGYYAFVQKFYSFDQKIHENI